MQIITKRLPRTHSLIICGDFHVGNVMTSYDGIRQMVQEIKKRENCYFVGIGDFIEAITVDDPRYTRLTDSGYDPLEQCYEAIELLKPIEGKILVLGQGNHEWKLHKFGDLVKNVLCAKLSVPYGTFSFKLNIKDKRSNPLFKVYCRHGARGISSSADDPERELANMKLILKRHLKKKAGDCAIMVKGHAHKLLVQKPSKVLYMTDNEKDLIAAYTKAEQTDDFIPPEHRWYVCSGSFLRTNMLGVSGYAERFGYDPVELGFPIIYIKDGIITDIERKLIA